MAQRAASTARPDEVIIRGNSFTIKRKDLDRELAYTLGKINIDQASLTKDQLQQFSKAAQKSLVRKALLKKASEDLSIEDLSARVDQKMKEYRSAFAKEEDFLAALKEQDISMDELKSQITDSIRIQELIRQSIPQPQPPSEEAVRSFFTENKEMMDQPEMIRVQHISVLVDKGAAEDVRQAKRKALEEIRQRVILGEDFSKLAREISQEKNDGDLGWIRRGYLGKEFDEIAFKLKPGQVSEIFTSDRGFHFVLVRDRKEAQKSEFKNVKPQIEKFLMQEAQLESIDKFVSQLEKQEKIIYMDALIKNKASKPSARQ
jgi:peptidyl-prolyl cis-trans isomerase C